MEINPNPHDGINLPRPLIKSDFWTSTPPEHKVVFITLLLMAAHEPQEVVWDDKVITLQSGQVITSVRSLAKAAGNGISVKNVRSAISRFESQKLLAQQVAQQVAHGGSLVTICKWSIYEPQKEGGGTAGGTTGGTPLAQQVAQQVAHETPTLNYSISDTYEGVFEEGGTAGGTAGGTRPHENPPSLACARRILATSINYNKQDNISSSSSSSHTTRTYVDAREAGSPPQGDDFSTDQEQEYLQQAKESGYWKQVTEMHFKISEHKLLQLLDEFFQVCQVRVQTHNNLKDFQRHFADWLRIQNQNAKPSPQQSSADFHEQRDEQIRRQVEFHLAEAARGNPY